MKNALELHPSRSVARRMYELETELERARIHLRSQSKSPNTTSRWGLEKPALAQQEEGWFTTYLDMMTLLLVVMIVMLAFSGTLGEEPAWLRHNDHSGVQLASMDARPAIPPTAKPQPVDTEPATATSSITAIIADGPVTEPAVTGSMGILPGGNGPLPSLAGLPDALAVSEPLAEPALGIIALPSEATATAGNGADPEPQRAPDPWPVTLDTLYPGWSAADLAASFVGPPRPTGPAAAAAIASGVAEAAVTEAAVTEAAVTEAAVTEAAVTEAAITDATGIATAASAAGESPSGHAATTEETTDTPPHMADNDVNPPSEGETLAAGLSLNELGGDVEVVVNERSVSFRVNSEILFDSSQTDLSRSGLAVLRRIAAVLSEAEHEITVEGHTDSVPVRRNVRFPSNWELSSARAGSVVRYLHANGIAKTRLKAIGYADTRPIADNHTPDGRARNRRVELLIEQNVAARPGPQLANRAQSADNAGVDSAN